MIVRMLVHIITFGMLLIIYVQHISEGKHYFLPSRLFRLLILSTMVTVTVEIMGWMLSGHVQVLWPSLILWSNVLVAACYLMPLFLWMLYVDFEIYGDINRLRNCLIFLFIPFLVNAGFILLRPASQHYFYLDVNNVFQRGSWPIVTRLTYYLLFSYNFWSIIANWQNINRKNRWSLVTFIFLPLLGLVIQSRVSSISLIWSGYSLSLLIIYITMQSHAIKTDYLTGLYNRRQLDHYLDTKIKNISAGQQFAGIMIDVDHFKNINDQFGHTSGDRALEAISTLLRSVFRRDDFIARYAGDEFVVLFDIESEETLKRRVAQLHEHLDMFNAKKREPFEIQISLGTAIYSSDNRQNSGEFLDYLDSQMYEQKRSKNTHQSVTST